MNRDLEIEELWLRYHVIRLRTALRHAKARQTEAVLKELIAEAETRLDILTNSRLKISG